VYDPATDSWDTLPPMPTARAGLAAALGVDGRIFAIGGVDTRTPTALDTGGSYEPAPAPLRTGTSMPTARNQPGAAAGARGEDFRSGRQRQHRVTRLAGSL